MPQTKTKTKAKSSVRSSKTTARVGGKAAVANQKSILYTVVAFIVLVAAIFFGYALWQNHTYEAHATSWSSLGKYGSQTSFWACSVYYPATGGHAAFYNVRVMAKIPATGTTGWQLLAYSSTPNSAIGRASFTGKYALTNVNTYVTPNQPNGFPVWAEVINSNDVSYTSYASYGNGQNYTAFTTAIYGNTLKAC